MVSTSRKQLRLFVEARQPTPRTISDPIYNAIRKLRSAEYDVRQQGRQIIINGRIAAPDEVRALAALVKAKT